MANSPEESKEVKAPRVNTHKSGTGSGKKHPRKSKSQILNKLVSQLKFYFSDSNLWKDKFLRQKMAESTDGFIAIGLIGSFAKMQSITRDLNLVSHAAKMCSPLLEVSDNGRSVRRKEPLPPPPSDLDERTLYIEQLPDNVDHDMIRKCFALFGHVAHVSLPKFKTKSTLKGFAFVEFTDTESATAALSYFTGDASAVATTTKSTKEEKKHDSDHEETTVKTNKRSHAEVESDNDDDETRSMPPCPKRIAPAKTADDDEQAAESSADDLPDVKPCKRSHAEVESDEEDESRPAPGRQKQDEQLKVDHSDKADSVATGNAADADADGEIGRAHGDGDGSEQKKKKRTRSHWRKKSKVKLIKDTFGDWKPSVMAKPRWQELKEEYKSLVQQQQVAAKEYLRRQREAQAELRCSSRIPPVESTTSLDDTGSQADSITESECFDSSTADDSAADDSFIVESEASPVPAASSASVTAETVTAAATPTRTAPTAATAAVAGGAKPTTAGSGVSTSASATSVSRPPSEDFVASTVIRVEWDRTVNTSVWTAALLKRAHSQFTPGIKFVDFKPNSHTAYVRCESAEETSKLLTHLVSHNSRTQSMRMPSTAFLLHGKEELVYWKQLEENRREKRSAQPKRCRRGKQRLSGQLTQLAHEQQAAGKAVEKIAARKAAQKSSSNHIVFTEEDT
eukprot:scpid80011/ scgid11258/ La-related protein 7; La ribonucleoprotein domain family member 7